MNDIEQFHTRLDKMKVQLSEAYAFVQAVLGEKFLTDHPSAKALLARVLWDVDAALASARNDWAFDANDRILDLRAIIGSRDSEIDRLRREIDQLRAKIPVEKEDEFGLVPSEAEALDRGDLIGAIKLYRSRRPVGLKEGKDHIERARAKRDLALNIPF